MRRGRGRIDCAFVLNDGFLHGILFRFGEHFLRMGGTGVINIDGFRVEGLGSGVFAFSCLVEPGDRLVADTGFCLAPLNCREIQSTW